MMGRAVLGVVIVGGVVGFLLPTGQSDAPSSGVIADTAKPIAAPAAAKPETTIVEVPRKTKIERSPDGHFYADALVNGASVHFVVDTGASIVALTMDDARRIGIPFDKSRFTVVGRGASGDVMGQAVTLRHVAIDRQEAFDVDAVILDEGLDTSLLGQSWLQGIDNVQINGNQMTIG